MIFFKRLLIAVGVVCLLFVFGMAAACYLYWQNTVSPVIERTNMALTGLSKEDRQLPADFQAMVRIANSTMFGVSVVNSLPDLNGRSTCPADEHSTAGWLACMYVNGVVVEQRFSEEELVQIWARYYYFGYSVKGWRAAAQERFGKSGDALSREELAELIAYGSLTFDTRDDKTALAELKSRLLAQTPRSSTDQGAGRSPR